MVIENQLHAKHPPPQLYFLNPEAHNTDNSEYFSVNAAIEKLLILW